MGQGECACHKYIRYVEPCVSSCRRGASSAARKVQSMKVTRRKLLIGASAGAATLGVLGAIPLLEAAKGHDQLHASAASLGPIMVYVTDPTSDAVTLLVNGNEVQFKDAALVSRLVQAAQ